jgi:hypothetical protein
MMIILGCDHCLQLPEFTNGFWKEVEQTSRARRQREGFRKTIEDLIETQNCTFVGEETQHGQDTPAVTAAREREITYKSIDMTVEERNRSGIPLLATMTLSITATNRKKNGTGFASST